MVPIEYLQLQQKVLLGYSPEELFGGLSGNKIKKPGDKEYVEKLETMKELDEGLSWNPSWILLLQVKGFEALQLLLGTIEEKFEPEAGSDKEAVLPMSLVMEFVGGMQDWYTTTLSETSSELSNSAEPLTSWYNMLLQPPPQSMERMREHRHYYYEALNEILVRMTTYTEEEIRWIGACHAVHELQLYLAQRS
eukprot:Filipodium_phascolosomae@DN6954_c0_g1_i1.p1